MKNISIHAIEAYNNIKSLLHRENLKYSYFEGNIIVSLHNDICWVCRINLNDSTITFPLNNYQGQTTAPVKSNNIVNYSHLLFNSLKTAKTYNSKILQS